MAIDKTMKDKLTDSEKTANQSWVSFGA